MKLAIRVSVSVVKQRKMVALSDQQFNMKHIKLGQEGDYSLLVVETVGILWSLKSVRHIIRLKCVSLPTG